MSGGEFDLSTEISNGQPLVVLAGRLASCSVGPSHDDYAL